MNFVNRVILGSLLVVAAMVLYSFVPEFKQQTFSIYISLLSLACLTMNIKYSARGIWSATSIFIIVFWCFHFGVITANAMGINVPEITGDDYNWWWIDSPFYPRAEALAVLGIASFVLVTMIRSRHLDDKTEEEEDLESFETHIDNTDSPYYKTLRALAYIFMLGGIGYWAFIMSSMGGVTALLAGYLVYLKFIENYPLISLVYWGIGIGFALLGVLGRKKDIRPGFILFCVWGGLAFTMGLRGEVMYPACAFLITFSRQVKMPWSPVYVVVPILLLSLISFVREYRLDGHVSSDSFNPVYGLLEMGGSLQTVVITQEWVAQGIDKFHYGETIYAPVARLVDKATFANVDASEKDFRLMNVAMADRNGPYGFSPIAEGFINMGAIGVVIVMMLLSLFLNYFDTRPISILSDSYLGGTTFILLTFVRNAFTHIPGQSLLLAVTLTIVYAFFKRKI